MLEDIAGMAGVAGTGAAAIGIAHSPLAVRVWETVEKTCVGILAPIQMRRMARAKEDIQISAALADRLVAQISAAPSVYLAGPANGGSNGVVRAEPMFAEGGPLLPDLIERAVTNDQARLVREALNVGAAILHAEAAVENDPAIPSDARVDDNWLVNWRDNAAKVSAEAAQLMWGRVLAGEVKNPGKYSLRTLDFLRLMSTFEAALVDSIAPFALGQLFFLDGRGVANSKGVTYSTFATLAELGLIELGQPGVDRPLISWQYSAKPLTFAGRTKLLKVEMAPGVDFKAHGYLITKLGREVISLVERDTDPVYVEVVAKALAEKQGLSVTLGDLVPTDPGTWTVANARKVHA